MVFGLWFNHKRKPWDDVKLRQAVARAIDPDDIVSTLGGAAGAVRSGFVPTFFQDYAWSEERNKERFHPDVEGARKLLSEAGYRPGQLKPLFKTIKTYQQEAEIALQGLSAIGLTTSLQVESSSITSVIREGDFDLAWGGRSSQLYASYWIGELVRTGSTLNDTGFSDPQVDQLVDALGREMNLGTRKQLVNRIQDRLYDRMSSVPVVSYYYHIFLSCRAKNWKPMNPTYNTSTVVQAWVDEAGC